MVRQIIESRTTDGLAEAKVKSYELIDEQTVLLFRDGLKAILDTGAYDVELDLSQVNMVSSMAICAVITIDRELKDRGGRLRLRQVHSGCLEVFSHMKLHELLDIQPRALAA